MSCPEDGDVDMSRSMDVDMAAGLGIQAQRQESGISIPLSAASVTVMTDSTPCEREFSAVSMMEDVRGRIEWVRNTTNNQGWCDVHMNMDHTPLAYTPVGNCGGLFSNTPTPLAGPWVRSPTDGSTPFTWSESQCVGASEQIAHEAIQAPVFPQDVGLGDGAPSRKRNLSFRSLVVSVNSIFVLLTCTLMFLTLEYSSTSIHDTMNRVGEALDWQKKLVQELIYQNVTDYSFQMHIRTCFNMVEDMIQLPAYRAVSALAVSLQTARHINSSWTVSDRELQKLAYRAWSELERPWNMGSDNWGAVQHSAFHAHKAAESLSVHFLSGASAGFQVVHESGACPQSGSDFCGACVGFCRRLRAEALMARPAENGSSLLEHLAADPATGRHLRLLRSQSRRLTDRTPGLTTQLRAAARLPRSPTRPLWSELHRLQGVMGLTWTMPIAPCGNYSCLEGTVEAEVTLREISLHCSHLFVRLQQLLASAAYDFPIGNENSSLFIVHVSSESPREETGLLVGSSDVYDINATMPAAEATQRVVRATARAVLARFGAWNATMDGDDHLFTFRMDTALAGGFEGCVPSSDSARDEGCQQVATLTVRMDEQTQWILVASLPGGAFNAPADGSTMDLKKTSDSLAEQFSAEIRNARLTAALVIFAITAMSTGLGFSLAYLVSEPLRRLSALMQQLSDLDFTTNYQDVQNARAWRMACIANVSELQDAFFRLLGAVEAFARFVPNTVVAQIVSGDRRATRLHVDKRDVTAMFATIANLTKLSESMEVENLQKVLTVYYNVMTKVVDLREGVVAEILDGGLLVYWNTPDTVVNHAAKACETALAMQHAMALLNEEFAREGWPALSLHAGIHSGNVMSGNIGSTKKMKFGCLGDSVNLASRLNGLCKYYGVNTVCSGSTYLGLRGHSELLCRQLDLVKVKGRREPTPIYEVVGKVNSEGSEAVAGSPRSSLSEGSHNSMISSESGNCHIPQEPAPRCNLSAAPTRASPHLAQRMPGPSSALGAVLQRRPEACRCERQPESCRCEQPVADRATSDMSTGGNLSNRVSCSSVSCRHFEATGTSSVGLLQAASTASLSSGNPSEAAGNDQGCEVPAALMPVMSHCAVACLMQQQAAQDGGEVSMIAESDSGSHINTDTDLSEGPPPEPPRKQKSRVLTALKSLPSIFSRSSRSTRDLQHSRSRPHLSRDHISRDHISREDVDAAVDAAAAAIPQGSGGIRTSERSSGSGFRGERQMSGGGGLITERERANVQRYEEALRLYQRASFEEARRNLELILQEEPGNTAARRLYDRTSCYTGNGDQSRRLSQAELAAWTGVTNMTEK